MKRDNARRWKKNWTKRTEDEEEALADINMKTGQVAQRSSAARLPTLPARGSPAPSLGGNPRVPKPRTLTVATRSPHLLALSPIGDSSQSYPEIASGLGHCSVQKGFSTTRPRAPGPQNIPVDQVSSPGFQGCCPCHWAPEPAGCSCDTSSQSVLRTRSEVAS
ncbi:hypothetical protein RJZ56_005829 [Blastomyces dermatitidis]